jgi:DNA mismatch repair protein MutS
MMKQYLEVKESCKDSLLFFRLGDFYEMFFDDARTVSKELDLVLTGRNCGMEERAPMCGVPYHAVQSYIARLINKGYKVAICEQMEDPAVAVGIVKRSITRIFTPGTVTEDIMLESNKNNYIICIYSYKGLYGLAASDVSTGEFDATSFTIGNTLNKLVDEIVRYSPSEIILNSEAGDFDGLKKLLQDKTGAYIGGYEQESFNYDNCLDRIITATGEKLPAELQFDLSVNASGALLNYISEIQRSNLEYIKNINFYKIEQFMVIDSSSRRNLELCETMRDKARKGSLLWVMDRTKTSMGGRTLRRWLEQPLTDVDEIAGRLGGVAELKELFMVRSELRELLSGIFDIERLAGKLATGNVSPRDLVSLKFSLAKIPQIKALLAECNSSLIHGKAGDLNELKDIFTLIDSSIVDEPPVNTKDGGFIKDGFNEETDTCRRAGQEGKTWLAELEARERRETGIKNLKVGYNRVFGYYIEVTKSNTGMVPERYVRKQTLAGNERYITDELKKLENTILGAEERLLVLEQKLFTEIVQAVAAQMQILRETADSLACLDALASYAEVADRENYCKPTVDESQNINIIDGRHPVVEKIIGQNAFVPNDSVLNCGEDMLLVITGPNMAGKSTYMRQVALIVLLAQAGSFVPASSAEIGIVDRIFTRVGASDDLASGQSTFMVEMSEVANILSYATVKSLLILDEIGRGTSTFDGLSIAWAVLEYITENIKARTLFATHYHELTELEGKMTGIKNYCVLVKKNGQDIVFLRKIKRGGADGSYGIQVAALAGIPKAVTLRADEILQQLEAQDIGRKEHKMITGKKSENQLDIFSFSSAAVMRDDIIEELKALDIQAITPIEAMNKLYSLYQKAINRK